MRTRDAPNSPTDPHAETIYSLDDPLLLPQKFKQWLINYVEQELQLKRLLGYQAPGSGGTAGPPGPAGPAGTPGSVWRDGTGVPSNTLGVDGDYYLDDATGNVYLRASGTYSVVANIKGSVGATGAAGATGPAGSTGPAGTPGSVWRDGTGAPASGLGVNGDYYLNDATGDVHLKSAGTYSIVANIKGATGATGSTGAAGQGVPVGGSTGQVLAKNSATNYDTLWSTPASGGVDAGAQLDYAQITANVGPISATTEATAVAVITGNSVAYDGSRVKVEFFTPLATLAAQVNWVLYRDSTVIGQAQGVPGNAPGQPVAVFVFDTPTAGAHTYKISVFVASGSATIKAGAGGTGVLVPAYLRVTRA